jgi:hypothetical protein
MSMNPVLFLFYHFILFLSFESSLQQSRRRRGNNPPMTRNISVALDNCPLGVQIRKEYRDMSPQEWQAFREALLTLQTSPSPDGGSYSEWDWLTRVHLDYVPVAHE